MFLKFFQTAASLYFSSEAAGTYSVAVSSMPNAPEHNGGSCPKQRIFVRLVHEPNTLLPKALTFVGSIISSKLVHPLKTPSSMFSNFSGRLIDGNLEHSEKASDFAVYDKETATEGANSEQTHTPQIMPKIPVKSDLQTEISDDILTAPPSQNIEPPLDND